MCLELEKPLRDRFVKRRPGETASLLTVARMQTSRDLAKCKEALQLRRNSAPEAADAKAFTFEA